MFPLHTSQRHPLIPEIFVLAEEPRKWKNVIGIQKENILEGRLLIASHLLIEFERHTFRVSGGSIGHGMMAASLTTGSEVSSLEFTNWKKKESRAHGYQNPHPIYQYKYWISHQIPSSCENKNSHSCDRSIP